MREIIVSYREKSAWVTFLLRSTLFATYFAFMALNPEGTPAYRSGGQLFVVLIVAVLAIELVSHFVMAYRTPKDAATPQDEREYLIEMRAVRPAYYALIAGVFFILVFVQHAPNKLLVLHSFLLVIWLAEIVRFAAQIIGYRRGA